MYSYYLNFQTSQILFKVFMCDYDNIMLMGPLFKDKKELKRIPIAIYQL